MGGEVKEALERLADAGANIRACAEGMLSGDIALDYAAFTFAHAEAERAQSDLRSAMEDQPK